MFDPTFEKEAPGSPIRASFVTSPSGGGAIDCVFRQRGQLLVRSFFLSEIRLQNLSAIRTAQCLRPGDQCPVTSHLVMLDRLR
jgi:hypothetical protein